MVVPVMMVPMVVMVPVVMPMPVVVPVHFFRLDTIDLTLRHDGGFSAGGHRGDPHFSRYRRQRCRLRAYGEQCAAYYKSHREFQNVPAFHDFQSLS